MKLASGTAPVPAYLRADVAVGLGTDGAASNNDLDMFEAMRFAALLHKHASVDPRALSARSALEMATIRGARAMGMQKRIGSLEAAKRADVITVSINGARQTPMYDAISHLVYVIRGDDVQNTIVKLPITITATDHRPSVESRIFTIRDGKISRYTSFISLGR